MDQEVAQVTSFRAEGAGLGVLAGGALLTRTACGLSPPARAGTWQGCFPGLRSSIQLLKQVFLKCITCHHLEDSVLETFASVQPFGGWVFCFLKKAMVVLRPLLVAKLEIKELL